MLKLYFRGLENPLFPKDRFNDLISCVRTLPSSLFPLCSPNPLFVFAWKKKNQLLFFFFCLGAAAGIENMYERAQCIRKILLGVPRATLVVMRYLFAFLNQ